MLRMIIADDEFIVRDGLKNIVPWEDFGIEVIADAVDGQEALELCNQLQPDILFTDIRMPMMDGLEVALRLKEQGSNTKIIIISGVQDFSYAKTALSVNAVGYILKPVKIDELKDVIKKVVNIVNMERNHEEKLLTMKKQLRDNNSAMREKFLRSLISNDYISELDVWKKVSYFSLPFQKGENIISAVMEIDDFDMAVKNYMEENRQLLTFAVLNIAEEILNNYNYGLCFSTKENELVIIFNQKAAADKKYLEACEEIVCCLNKFLKVSASVGIGSPVSNILDLSISYNEALTALKYRFYTGNNSILNIMDIKLDNNDIQYPDLYKTESQLMNFLKIGDSSGIACTMEALFNYLCANNKLPVDYVQNICIELVCIAARNVYEFGENFDNIAASRSVILDNIYKTRTIFGLKEYMLSIFLKISDYFSTKYSQKNSKVIEKIRDIINCHYMNNISISEISKEIYLSPNYISLIFRQETGETITEYLTTVRMEHAKDLLKTTDYKIFEVAEMVGYDNANYFSTVFKKHTGVHPQKFRS